MNKLRSFAADCLIWLFIGLVAYGFAIGLHALYQHIIFID